MPYFKNPYEESEYEGATRIWIEDFGLVTEFEADCIEERRADGYSNEQIKDFLKEI